MEEQVKADFGVPSFIAITANELQVGDRWNGKVVTAVEPLFRRLLIHFYDGGAKTMDPTAQMLIERGVERIEAVAR